MERWNLHGTLAWCGPVGVLRVRASSHRETPRGKRSMSKTRILVATMVLAALTLLCASTARADFLGLFPSTVQGTCTSVSGTCVSVLDSKQHPYVFVLPTGMTAPPALVPGRVCKVEYKKRKDGLLEVKNIKVLR